MPSTAAPPGATIAEYTFVDPGVRQDKCRVRSSGALGLLMHFLFKFGAWSPWATSFVSLWKILRVWERGSTLTTVRYIRTWIHTRSHEASGGLQCNIRAAQAQSEVALRHATWSRNKVDTCGRTDGDDVLTLVRYLSVSARKTCSSRGSRSTNRKAGRIVCSVH